MEIFYHKQQVPSLPVWGFLCTFKMKIDAADASEKPPEAVFLVSVPREAAWLWSDCLPRQWGEDHQTLGDAVLPQQQLLSKHPQRFLCHLRN